MHFFVKQPKTFRHIFTFLALCSGSFPYVRAKMDNENLALIESRIMNLRGQPILLDRDLADLYGIETKVLNQTVRRNIERFPEDFMFQLDEEELEDWRSQFVTSNSIKMGVRHKPYAFTEQGVAMLSGLLRSEQAIRTNILIMRAFVAMRRFLLSNAQVFHRLERVEFRQSELEENVGRILDKLDGAQPRQGLFFDGQVFDSYLFIVELLRRAQSRIVLIDNYIDDTVLTMLDKRLPGVSAQIYTSHFPQTLQLDLTRHNAQYPAIEIHMFDKSHDRFLLIDDDVYLIGASLKDIGKKWFGVSLIKDWTTNDLLAKMNL